MAYRWASPETDADVGARAGLGRSFPTQADAEAWLAATYEDLAEEGVDAVVLLEEDRVVYGPMSLHP